MEILTDEQLGSVGVVSRLWVGQPTNQGSISNKGRGFALLETGYGAHPASYPWV
jgi:hypothetical protein